MLHLDKTVVQLTRPSVSEYDAFSLHLMKKFSCLQVSLPGMSTQLLVPLTLSSSETSQASSDDPQAHDTMHVRVCADNVCSLQVQGGVLLSDSHTRACVRSSSSNASSAVLHTLDIQQVSLQHAQSSIVVNDLCSN